MCQANIRKQAAQIALKKIVLLLNLKINLLLSIPVLLSVHQIFVQYIGLHGKTVVLVGKNLLAEIKVSVLVDNHLTIVNHSHYHRIPKNHECLLLLSLSLRGRRRLRRLFSPSIKRNNC